jgi:hypothetical protein
MMLAAAANTHAADAGRLQLGLESNHEFEQQSPSEQQFERVGFGCMHVCCAKVCQVAAAVQ